MIQIPATLLALVERHALIVVPTMQRAVALELAYSVHQTGAGRTSWRRPRILTWRSWLESRARHSPDPSFLLPELEERFLWADAARRAWREASEPSDELIESLRHAALTLFEWAIPERTLLGTPESEWLARAIRQCDAACADRGATARYRLPSRALGESSAGQGFLAGFTSYTPVQQALIAADVLAPLNPEAGPRTASRGVSAENRTQEIALAAQWARQRLETDPAARLLVLLPGLRQRAHEVIRRFEQTLQPRSALQTRRSTVPVVALEGGRELNDFPIIKQRLAMLRPPQASLPVPEFLGWLRLVTADLGDAAASARLDAWLRTMLEPETSLAAAMQLLANVPASLETTAEASIARLNSIQALAWNTAAPMAYWTAEFRRLSTTLDRQRRPSPAVSAEQQTSARLDALLDEFARSIPASTAMTGETAAALLAAAAAQTRFEPASGDASVTLSGALTDPIVQYDGIWVAGLDAESWPPPARLDAFIPASVQRAAGILESSAARLARDAEARMHVWARSGLTLVLSGARFDAGLERRASTLAMRFVEAQAFEHPPAPASLAQILFRSDQLERFDDALGLKWNTDKIVPGGARALELQAQCAFRAYAELRLRAQPIESRAAGIDPRDRGRLLHKALENLWRDLGSGAGLKAAFGALDARIDRAVHQAEAQLGWGDETHDAYRHRLRERRRLAGLLRALCELDARRPEFLEVRCESETTFELAGAKLSLRIDRIDTLADENVAIFDYKSGKPRMLDLAADRLVEPQLPLYALASGRPVDAVAIAHLTASAVTLRGLAARDGLIGRVEVAPDWAAQLVRWRDQLEVLAARFVAGDALRDPADDACRYCHLQIVCRISRLHDDGGETSDD